MIFELQRWSLNLQNKKPLIGQAIGSICALSWVRNCVFVLISLPIILDFNFKSLIKSISILILVFHYLLVQKFLSNLLMDFSMNLDPNFVIFYSVDLPSSYLYENIEILNFSPHFIV